MKLQVRICDDNREHIKEIENAILSLKERYEIEVLSFLSGTELLASFDDRIREDKGIIRIVLLDVELEEENGIDVGIRIKENYPDSYLVFLTAYSEYAIKGYEAKAYRYLLKPITTEMLHKLVSSILDEQKKVKRLAVKDNDCERLIALQDIIYVSAEDKYTILHTEDGRYFDSKSLRYYEELLVEFGFCRTHRKYLVNMYHHKSLRKGTVRLSNDIELPISRRKETQYKEDLLRMMENNLL